MPFARLYAGDDGQSHIEHIELDDHPDWTTIHDAKGVVFRVSQPGSFSDWHHAPQRQYVITLAGEGEIGLGDGTLFRFGPGQVTFCEDMTGQGHTTRVIGDVPRVVAWVTVPD
ncbi:MAG: hypothetical protein FI707_03940 [SAR202 cluster bacterium]|jgi:quercetin dioxygenase-like cupin family protein|nr:hypothetical protein [Chloroflexota bacterium]MDP6420462.1 hypothetical protein [SAR202 cluster bacterium]HAL48270.1 hypothetical protein [Dehalococcoidia bacterium]MDP6665159.1 hypothetical protein [SAR202 cluster bacterium]MDP6800707.1 hypothetical protein [SAR202 cluster bacterium]|tara:strand:- start:100 stop:438 length:339 start_codon:yes stop_codon:yes gene_type:complete